MQPKKKSSMTPVIYGLCLIFVIFMALHGAMAYESAVQMAAAGEIEQNNEIFTCIELWSVRVGAEPFSISFNQYTRDWLLWGCFGWLIVVLALENKKKNYISGKEFGTARWGTLADIKDLFASSIEAEEIKRAKQTRTPWGRWRAKAKLYKKCEADGQAIRNAKLEELKAEEAARKANGTADRRLYKERQEQIKREAAETVALSKRQAWKPDQLKADYESRIREIEETPALVDKEKELRKEQAKQEYEKKRKEFYNYSKRVAKIRAKYKDADMLFTKTERISFYNYQLNQNTLILGGSGSGKTRGYVMPNILQAHSSYIVTDPKGEILEKAGYFLSQIKGYKIRVLNLDEKTQSDGYNPFMYIHPEREGYEERVLSLIETIIINTDGGEKKGGSDPFWDKAERLFLQAVFFFTTDGFVEEERNMNTVLKLIGMLQLAEEEDDMNSDLDIFAKIFAERFGEQHIGVQQYREFREKASGKTAKSIVISAVARLAPFRTSEVRRIFSYDSMHLDRVGEEKTAIFVVVPPTDTTFNFIAGMLFTQLFQELQYCATQVHKHDGQRLPVPCRFILDEFANTCTIPQFVKILAYARSFGIGITPILQSLEQIKNMYKDEWGVIVDNCNTLLYLGSISHMDTLEYMSKLLGKGTFDKRTTGHSRGKSGSSSENFDVVGRELMDSAEIRKLPKKDCLFIVGGRNPFYSEKYDYASHPNYCFTSDSNRELSFHYVPEKAPETEEEDSLQYEEEAALEPSENAKVEIDPIRMDLSETNQLTRMINKLDDLHPIDDELLSVDDGEDDTEELMKMLEDLIREEEAEEESEEDPADEDDIDHEFFKFLMEDDDEDDLQNDLMMDEDDLNERLQKFLMEDEDEDDLEDEDDIDETSQEFIMDEEETDEEELKDILDDLSDVLKGFDEEHDPEE